MGLQRGTAALIVALGAMSFGGCGDDRDEGPAGGAEAVDLVKQMPQDGVIYSTVDVTALEEGLGLTGSTDLYFNVPPKLSEFTSGMLNGIAAGHPRPEFVNALRLSSATALALSNGPEKLGDEVTAVASSADQDEIRADLLDMGFVDHDGVLEGPDGKRAIPQKEVQGKSDVVYKGRQIKFKPKYDQNAVKFIDGGFLVSDNGELLRSIGEPADEVPISLLDDLGGDAAFAVKIDNHKTCITQYGISTNADGSGTAIFEVEGAADPGKFTPDDSPTFGEPEADGDRLTVPVTLDEPEDPRAVQADEFPGYEC